MIIYSELKIMAKKLSFNSFCHELAGKGLKRVDFSTGWTQYKAGTSLDDITKSLNNNYNNQINTPIDELKTSSNVSNNELLTAVKEHFMKYNNDIYYEKNSLLKAYKVAMFDLLMKYDSDLMSPLVKEVNKTIKILPQPKTIVEITSELYDVILEDFGPITTSESDSDDEIDIFWERGDKYFEELNFYVGEIIKKYSFKVRDELCDFNDGASCDNMECYNDSSIVNDNTYITYYYNIVSKIGDEVQCACKSCFQSGENPVEIKLYEKITDEFDRILDLKLN